MSAKYLAVCLHMVVQNLKNTRH